MWSLIKICLICIIGINRLKGTHPCQVWFNLVLGFQRRRFKCESLRRTTYGRTTTDVKWWQKLTWPLARLAKNVIILENSLAWPSKHHIRPFQINSIYYYDPHIDILNLISLKNVTWHLTFRSINRWTLGRMVISTAREKTPMDIPLWASLVFKSVYFPWYTITTRRWHDQQKLLNMGHHLVSVVRFELDQISMALCRIFDVIKQLSTL
jgi:hypothetical protein